MNHRNHIKSHIIAQLMRDHNTASEIHIHIKSLQELASLSSGALTTDTPKELIPEPVEAQQDPIDIPTDVTAIPDLYAAQREIQDDIEGTTEPFQGSVFLSEEHGDTIITRKPQFGWSTFNLNTIKGRIDEYDGYRGREDKTFANIKEFLLKGTQTMSNHGFKKSLKSVGITLLDFTDGTGKTYKDVLVISNKKLFKKKQHNYAKRGL